MNNINPLVSVFMMAYNHENFISQAIEGVLIQKTNFDFEIIIGEDCSKDKTRQIILDYQKKYPGKFKLLLHEKNIGAMANQNAVFAACTGKYIALCEGDDYWTDPYKLQKQVDFLEANEEYSMCFHEVDVISNNDKDYTTNMKLVEREAGVFCFDDLLKFGNIMHTASVVFRNNIDKMHFFDSITGDYFLHLHNAFYGKIKYIDEVMAKYRVHEGGVFSQRDNWNIDKKIFNAKIQISAFENAKKTYADNHQRKMLFNEKLFSENNKLRFYLLENKDYGDVIKISRKMLLLMPLLKLTDLKTLMSIIITAIRPQLLSNESSS